MGQAHKSQELTELQWWSVAFGNTYRCTSSEVLWSLPGSFLVFFLDWTFGTLVTSWSKTDHYEKVCEVKGQWSPGDQCQCPVQRQCVYGMWETPRTCPITLASGKCGVMSEESNASAYVRCLTRYLCQSSQPKGASRLWKRLLRVSLTRVVKIAPYYSLKSLVVVTVWLTVGCNTHGLEVCCRDLCERCCWYLGTEC